MTKTPVYAAVLALTIAGSGCTEASFPTSPTGGAGAPSPDNLAAPASSTGVSVDAMGRGNGRGRGHCLVGATLKDEVGPDFTLTAPAGEVIEQVSVKAGTPCYTFTADGTDGCYVVSGLGTETVTVTGGGTGPSCKDISHIEATTMPGGGGGPDEPDLD